MTKTTLNCTQTTATLVFILIGSLFCLAGCAQLYKSLGLTEEQTQEQISEDQQTITRVITITRNTAADIITTAVAGLGAIASGFLAKWLHTERKITDTLITTIESNSNAALKQMIQAKAKNRGIEPKLAARVKALT